MAAAQAVTDLPEPNATHHVAHPLCPLTASEISRTANLVRSVWPSNIDLRFKVITLLEPAKKDLIPHLDAEHNGRPFPQIPRKAIVAYYIRNTVSESSLRLCVVLMPAEPLP
jgi:primary-amine oxidase